jgi:hypothetical protein
MKQVTFEMILCHFVWGLVLIEGCEMTFMLLKSKSCTLVVPCLEKILCHCEHGLVESWNMSIPPVDLWGIYPVLPLGTSLLYLWCLMVHSLCMCNDMELLQYWISMIPSACRLVLVWWVCSRLQILCTVITVGMKLPGYSVYCSWIHFWGFHEKLHGCMFICLHCRFIYCWCLK